MSFLVLVGAGDGPGATVVLGRRVLPPGAAEHALQHPDPFFPAPQLIHAAAHGRPPDHSGVSGRMHAEDSLDLCYVKDTGYEPVLDTERASADYIAWLRAGNGL